MNRTQVVARILLAVGSISVVTAACTEFGEVDPPIPSDAAAPPATQAVEAGAPPPDAQILPGTPVDPKLAPIPKQTVVLGKTAKIPFSVVRGRLDGDIAMEVAGLPRGVTAKLGSVPKGSLNGELELAATEDAATGLAKVTLTAKGGGFTFEQAFDLDVRGVPFSLDKSLGTNGIANVAPAAGSSEISAYALPAGKTLFFSALGGRFLNLRRLSADGSPDPTFGNAGVVEFRYGPDFGTNNFGRSSLMTSTGDIVTVVAAYPSGESPVIYVAKWTANGQPAAAFGQSGSTQVTMAKGESAASVAQTPDGGFVVAVSRRDSTSTPSTLVGDVRLFKFGPTGARDLRWGGTGEVVETCGISLLLSPRIFVDPMGRVRLTMVAVTEEPAFFGQPLSGAVCGVRYDAVTGARDMAFGLNGVSRFQDVRVRHSSRQLPGGVVRPNGDFDFPWVGDDTFGKWVRIGAGGLLDATVGMNGINTSVGGTLSVERSGGGAVDAQQRTLFGFATSSSNTLMQIARFAPGGGNDGFFAADVPAPINEPIRQRFVLVHPDDGRVVVVGGYDTGIQAPLYMARFWP